MEFSMDDYDRAVQDPEYIRRISEPVTVTPHTPITNPTNPTQDPEIKQEPITEGPITEIPQEEPSQPKPRKSREGSNLESGLNGSKWQCVQEHGIRLRIRNNFTKINNEPSHCNNCKDWDSENWDNIYYFETKTPEEAKDERD